MEGGKCTYGLRESSRLWCDPRDQEPREIGFVHEGGECRLHQSFAEENLWLALKQGEDEVQGVVLVYVDDLLVLSEERIVGEAWRQIRQKWETSAPQWANSEEPLRFCGLAILRQENGDFFAGQNAFIRELVKRRSMTNEFSALPCRNVPEPEEEFEKSPELTKEAQQLAGNYFGSLRKRGLISPMQLAECAPQRQNHQHGASGKPSTW